MKGRELVADEVDHRLVSHRVAAQAGEGLGKRAHDDVHFILQAEIIGRAAAAFADNAKAVRVVHHYARAIFAGQRHNFRQFGDVAAMRTRRR